MDLRGRWGPPENRVTAMPQQGTFLRLERYSRPACPGLVMRNAASQLDPPAGLGSRWRARLRAHYPGLGLGLCLVVASGWFSDALAAAGQAQGSEAILLT